MLQNLRSLVNDFKNIGGTGEDFLKNMYDRFSKKADDVYSRISEYTTDPVEIIYMEEEKISLFSWSNVSDTYIKNDANGRVSAMTKFIDFVDKDKYKYPIKFGYTYPGSKPMLYFDVSEISDKNLVNDCEKQIIEMATVVYDDLKEYAVDGNTQKYITSYSIYDRMTCHLDESVQNINKSQRFDVPIIVKNNSSVYFDWS